MVMAHYRSLASIYFEKLNLGLEPSLFRLNSLIAKNFQAD
jgi:hypothetical protein